jgi:hypothetical protein
LAADDTRRRPALIVSCCGFGFVAISPTFHNARCASAGAGSHHRLSLRDRPHAVLTTGREAIRLPSHPLIDAGTRSASSVPTRRTPNLSRRGGGSISRRRLGSRGCRACRRLYLAKSFALGRDAITDSAAWEKRLDRESREVERERTRAEGRQRARLPPEPPREHQRQRRGFSR